MNNEVVNETLLYLNEPKLALDFLVRNLGFVILDHTVSKNPDCVSVCDSCGDFYEVVLHKAKNKTGENIPPLVIKTNDCLQDFYNLKLKDINILTEPHYISEGLAFEISDSWHNRYTFLEKRDYSDQ